MRISLKASLRQDEGAISIRVINRNLLGKLRFTALWSGLILRTLFGVSPHKRQ